MRFVAVQEPPHQSWAVFDTTNDQPAEHAGRVLIGLTSHEAQRFTAAANDEAGCRKTNALQSRPGG
ncbi:hypothetical protein EH240_23350 [Mesorhizobium tamadayense]|uniref:Uncharacterized protein n=1 Tax=Mesorhizobium tamadayense TaxID=425306 RepID=A0A3P3FBA7_9HYPH|nr:hypothetical protein [Mesorhizobium tamadayense]RRH95949.1 hypothetical protein EH240_23350 [Mesorhizobium tamadayense]